MLKHLSESIKGADSNTVICINAHRLLELLCSSSLSLSEILNEVFPNGQISGNLGDVLRLEHKDPIPKKCFSSECRILKLLASTYAKDAMNLFIDEVLTKAILLECILSTGLFDYEDIVKAFDIDKLPCDLQSVLNNLKCFENDLPITIPNPTITVEVMTNIMEKLAMTTIKAQEDKLNVIAKKSYDQYILGDPVGFQRRPHRSLY